MTTTDSMGQKIARKLAHTNGADGARIIWPIDVHTVAAIIDAELARERDAWVSVKERLPEKGKRVLVYFANVLAGPYFDVWEFSGANQYFAAEPSCNPKEDVTHWQPLPAPPACGS